MWSLPSRECGLKCSGKSFVDTAYIVTPFAGVWIEIWTRRWYNSPQRCHSLRGSVDWNQHDGYPKCLSGSHSLRGSVDWNPQGGPYRWIDLLSLPSRECGLKYGCEWYRSLPERHSLRGSVDWNCIMIESICIPICHSLRGSVDWNTDETDTIITGVCHSLRGSVDWNNVKYKLIKKENSHSLRGSVDWNFLCSAATD